MDDYNNSEGIKTSKLNSAGLINEWMHLIWRRADTGAMNCDFNKWNSALNSIWMNLASDASDLDWKRYQEINKKLDEANFKIVTISKSGFDPAEEDHIINKDMVYTILSEKHIFLKEIENKQGKGVAYIDELEDDFE